ncbi:MAG: phage portal protein [Sphingomonadales bacterium]|nr:phage portal protein [Sphingomonadales bacterium]
MNLPVTARRTVMDRIIGVFSPVAEYRRVSARASTNLLTGGGYRAGGALNRIFGRWAPDPMSADAAYVPDMDAVRSRSRDSARNHPIAAAAIGRQATSVVGTGLKAHPELNADRLGLSESQAEELEQEIAEDYDAYLSSTDPDASQRCTGYDQQDIVFRATAKSGDIFPVHVMARDQQGREHTTSFALFEADRVSTPDHHFEGQRINDRGDRIVAGVEMDRIAAPIAYHMLRKHPCDVQLDFRKEWVRVPKFSPSGQRQVNHVYFMTDPEQTRGVPVLAPVLEQLKQVSDLSRAELFAAILASMVALIYKSPQGAALPNPFERESAAAEEAARQDPAGKLAVSKTGFQSGTVLELATDHDVTSPQLGRPNPEFDPFFISIVKQIGAAIEMPYEVLMLSFSNNYVPVRGSIEIFWQWVMKSRGWLARGHCDFVYHYWLAEQVMRGRYAMPGFFEDRLVRRLWSKVQHFGTARISLDPLRDARSDEICEDRGWKFGGEITRERTGGDFWRKHRERKREHTARVDAGLEAPVEHRERREESTTPPLLGSQND